MRKRLIRWSMQTVLGTLAFFARRPRLAWISGLLTRTLARATVRTKGIGRARGAGDLGTLWQRSFPSAKQVPIETVSGNTVIAQIHTPCPLRGSGDLHACHRMMEFDREVLRRAGGRFVVLESQATPGVAYCRVAMRLAGEPMDDLVPAHLRKYDTSGADSAARPRSR
ncbi:MAG TPA: hypothetical protein VEC06_14875 [Paucimonas sp.]|nr:hypothetical protein [Paucimonas sp.]